MKTMNRPVRFWAAAAGLVGLAVILVIVLGGRNSPPLPPLPRAAGAVPPPPGDPLIYRPDRQAEFVARAAAGAAHPLYVKTPGGVVATAARVARFRGLINQVTAGTSVDPRTVEGIVFLESAGDPEATAGGDPAGAAGLTQIEAATGRFPLGLSINLAASERLTAQIDAAASNGRSAQVARLERQRARIDDRFDPRKALAATVRYLELAQHMFGRADLAVESYHMGMGNLMRVLNVYDGGAPVPYAQLYFDSAPDRHAAAYALLSSFGDDSWTYLWRVAGPTSGGWQPRNRSCSATGPTGPAWGAWPYFKPRPVRRPMFFTHRPRHRRSPPPRRWTGRTPATRSFLSRPTHPT
jgi:hypothetical protein